MKRVNNWLSPKCEARFSKTHGRGVFAKEKIKKDEIVAAFGGHIMTRKERDALQKGIGDLALGIDDDLFIGPYLSNETDDADWFNHSCNPNAGIWGQIFLVAMKDIEKGKEITFDYVMSCSQKTKKRVLFVCSCNSSNCRKQVTNHDWKNPELQKRYKSYFSNFVQRNIDELNIK